MNRRRSFIGLHSLQGIWVPPTSECVNHVSGIFCKLSVDNYSSTGGPSEFDDAGQFVTLDRPGKTTAGNSRPSLSQVSCFKAQKLYEARMP